MEYQSWQGPHSHLIQSPHFTSGQTVIQRQEETYSRLQSQEAQGQSQQLSSHTCPVPTAPERAIRQQLLPLSTSHDFGVCIISSCARVAPWPIPHLFGSLKVSRIMVHIWPYTGPILKVGRSVSPYLNGISYSLPCVCVKLWAYWASTIKTLLYGVCQENWAMFIPQMF